MQGREVDPALEQLQAHVRGAIGSRLQYAQTWRCDEITRLAVRHWPHHHLDAIEVAGGMHHSAIDHAMALTRAQIREQWEARYGVGPLWNLVLSGTATAVCHILLGLWWQDIHMRRSLREMAERMASRPTGAAT